METMEKIINENSLIVQKEKYEKYKKLNDELGQMQKAVYIALVTWLGNN